MYWPLVRMPSGLDSAGARATSEPGRQRRYAPHVGGREGGLSGVGFFDLPKRRVITPKGWHDCRSESSSARSSPRRGGMIVDNDFKCAVFCGIAKKPTLVRRGGTVCFPRVDTLGDNHAAPSGLVDTLGEYLPPFRG